MKIIFLVIDYMPHQLTSINSLVENYDVEVHSITFKKSIPSNVLPKHFYYQYNETERSSFLKLIVDLKPEALVVAGWLVSDYTWLSKKVRKYLSIPIIAYSDTPWYGTFRQKINCLISPLHLKRAFTHIWVAGIYQFEYARRLGYAKSNILFNALSCGPAFFYNLDDEFKVHRIKEKKLLFVGRFVNVKGLDLLLEAWANIQNKNGWELTLIGAGPLKPKGNLESVILKDYMNNNDLINEMNNAACFILPSIFEPWGVVLHEAAAIGLPIIASNVCGAVPHFLVNNFNGYIVEPNSKSIQVAISKIINLEKEQLIKFSQNSRKLASSITPDKGAASIYSIISKK